MPNFLGKDEISCFKLDLLKKKTCSKGNISMVSNKDQNQRYEKSWATSHHSGKNQKFLEKELHLELEKIPRQRELCYK